MTVEELHSDPQTKLSKKVFITNINALDPKILTETVRRYYGWGNYSF